MTRDFLELLELLEDGCPDPGAVAEAFGRLWEGLALEEERLLPDAWQSHLVGRVLDGENSFSLRAERGQMSASVPEQARRDLLTLRELFALDAAALLDRVESAVPALAGIWVPWTTPRQPKSLPATRSLASSRRLEIGERAWSFLRVTTPGKAWDPSAATGLSTGGRGGFGLSPVPTP